MKRRTRVLLLAGYFVVGGYVMQAGACWTIGVNTLVAGAAGTLIDANGKFLGLVNVCGIPDVLVVDQNGVSTGDVQFTEDDLFVGCPYTTITASTGTGGGGT